jgi:hypothetical protein
MEKVEKFCWQQKVGEPTEASIEKVTELSEVRKWELS